MILVGIYLKTNCKQNFKSLIVINFQVNNLQTHLNLTKSVSGIRMTLGRILIRIKPKQIRKTDLEEKKNGGGEG